MQIRVWPWEKVITCLRYVPYMEIVVKEAILTQTREFQGKMETKRASEGIEEILGDLNLQIRLKDEQQRIIQALIKGYDVFGVLPTGFGKSMTYTLMPLIKDKVHT